MDDKSFKAIALLAFRAAEEPDYEAFIRKVQRWYSRSFSTPLAEVEGMADEVLLQTYFEDRYCELADTDSDDGHRQYAETRGKLMNSFAPPTQEDGELDDDTYWEKALEEEFKRDNPHLAEKLSGEQKPTQKVPITAQAKAHQVRESDDGWSHLNTPNLAEGHQDIHMQADDPIPED